MVTPRRKRLISAIIDRITCLKSWRKRGVSQLTENHWIRQCNFPLVCRLYIDNIGLGITDPLLIECTFIVHSISVPSRFCRLVPCCMPQVQPSGARSYCVHRGSCRTSCCVSYSPFLPRFLPLFLLRLPPHFLLRLHCGTNPRTMHI